MIRALVLLILAIACLPGALAVGGMNGLWFVGILLTGASIIAAYAAHAPLISEDDPQALSRLDSLDGVGEPR